MNDPRNDCPGLGGSATDVGGIAREKASFRFTAGTRDRIDYLRQEWRIESSTAVIEAALRYLEQQTRRGLQRLDLTDTT